MPGGGQFGLNSFLLLAPVCDGFAMNGCVVKMMMRKVWEYVLELLWLGTYLVVVVVMFCVACVFVLWGAGWMLDGWYFYKVGCNSCRGEDAL